MPTPRKSTAELELTGAFKKNPKRARARANEPKPAGPLGLPPAGLDAIQIQIWTELVSQIPPKVLTVADRILVEICVRMIRKLRSGKIHGGELAILMQSLSRMGLTPADRSKVIVPKEENAEDLDPIAALEKSLAAKSTRLN